MGAPAILQTPSKSIGDVNLQDMGLSNPQHQAQGMLSQQCAHTMVAAYIKENEELLGAVAALQECNGALESHAAALATENAELKKVQFQLRQQLADALSRLEAEERLDETALRLSDSATEVPGAPAEDCAAWSGFKQQASAYRPVKCPSAVDVPPAASTSPSSTASPYRTSPRSWIFPQSCCKGDGQSYTNPLASTDVSDASDASSFTASSSSSTSSPKAAPSVPPTPFADIIAASNVVTAHAVSSPKATESNLARRLSYIPKMADLVTGSINGALLAAASASVDIDSWAELQVAGANNADKAGALPERHSFGPKARMWSLSSVSSAPRPADAAAASPVPPSPSSTATSNSVFTRAVPSSSLGAPPSPLLNVWSRCKRAVNKA